MAVEEILPGRFGVQVGLTVVPGQVEILLSGEGFMMVHES